MASNWLNTAAAAGFAVSLFAGPAMAQNAYSDWDTNADGRIDSTEWSTGFDSAGVFDRCDANDDDMLSSDELNGCVGLDQTGAVGTETEGGSPFTDRFGASANAEWDTDGDGNISREEFNTGAFAGYDEDAGGGIEESEFGNVNTDLGDTGMWGG